MKSRWVLAGFVGFVSVIMSSCSTSSSTVTNPTTGYMWVATQGNQMINSYTIDLTNGAASQVGGSVPSGLGPIAMAINPAGTALFIANRDDNTISSYKVNSDGTLTAGSSTSTTVVSPIGCANNCTVVLGQTPLALAMDPAGKFLFVAEQGSGVNPGVPGTVSVFSISGTGLTLVGPACPANYSQSVCPVVVIVPGTVLGPEPSGLATAGNFLYVADQFTGTVSIFSYDSSGNLTEALASPVTVGTNPTGIALSRCAGATAVTAACPAVAPPAYLFVANSGSQNISVFSACVQVTTACASANGTLSQITGSPTAAGIGPISVMVNPARNLVYVVDNGSFQVSEYRYSPATGSLTPLSPAVASTGPGPLTGSVTSDGNWLFVPNNGASDLSVFGIGAAGQLNQGTAVPLLVGQPSVVLIR